MVLTYDAYNETLEKDQEKETKMQQLQEKYEQDMRSMREEMETKFQQILTKIDTGRLIWLYNFFFWWLKVQVVVINDLTINEEYRLDTKIDELTKRKVEIEISETKHWEELRRIESMREEMEKTDSSKFHQK